MLLHKWLFPLKNRPQRHCFVDIQVRKSYQRLHSNVLLSLNDLSHWDVIIWCTQGCWFQSQRVSLTDTLLSGQCRFLRWAESRVSPILKVPLFTELNRTVCCMSLLCPHILSLRGCSSDGEKRERKMFFFSSCLQNEELVLLRMRE